MVVESGDTLRTRPIQLKPNPIAFSWKQRTHKFSRERPPDDDEEEILQGSPSRKRRKLASGIKIRAKIAQKPPKTQSRLDRIKRGVSIHQASSSSVSEKGGDAYLSSLIDKLPRPEYLDSKPTSLDELWIQTQNVRQSAGSMVAAANARGFSFFERIFSEQQKGLETHKFQNFASKFCSKHPIESLGLNTAVPEPKISFSIHLFQNGFSLNSSETNWRPYDQIGMDFLNTIDQGLIPAFLSQRNSARKPYYYEGCLVAEIFDYRMLSLSCDTPERYRVLLRPTFEASTADIEFL